MPINKVVFGNETLIDLTTDTVASADDILLGKVGHLRDGTVVTGTASGGDPHGTIWQDGNGNVHLDDESGIALQSKTVTPTESQQIVEAGEGYYALDKVTVGAISTTYVGSGIARKSSSDLTAVYDTVKVPAGYYASQASKTVASGIEGTPSLNRSNVSNNSVTITPTVTNIAGYINGGIHTGNATTVTASQLVSGAKTITENGTGIDVTNYASVDVDVASSAGPVIHLHGTGSSYYAYVQLNGTKYYQEADIPFTAGDELYICATPPDYGANIYVDYVNVASNLTASAEYTYLLKNFSIDVELSASRFASSITVLTPFAEADKITLTGSFTTNANYGAQQVLHKFDDGGTRYLTSIRIWLDNINDVPAETAGSLIVLATYEKEYPKVAPAYTGSSVEEDKLFGGVKYFDSPGTYKYSAAGGYYKNANASGFSVNVKSTGFYIYVASITETHIGFIPGVKYLYELTFATNTGE